jgi:outer membrane protein assembly complex protein YaeT
VALLTAAAAGPAGAQDALPSELRHIQSVRFEGRRSVPAKALRSVLKTRAAGMWSLSERPLLRADFLRADTAAIEQVYRQHGFLSARAGVRLDPGSRADLQVVTFVVREGRRSRIDDVAIEGATQVAEAQLGRGLYARPGRPFNPVFLVADTARIASVYRERGFFPSVSARAERDSLEVDVHYHVREGPRYHAGDVRLVTPEPLRVKERLVLRELTFRPGDVYRASRVEDSIQEIYGTGMFSQVQMTAFPDSSRRVVDFDLRVRERRPRWVDTGVGSGTAERLRATAEWGHRNLNARGLQSVVSTRLALDGNARFLLARVEGQLYDPWVLRSRRRGLVTVYYEKRHDRTHPSWIVRQEARGFTFQVRREYRRFTRLVLTQDNVYVGQDIRFNESGIDRAVLDSLTLDVPARYSTHRLQLALDRDTRDDLFSPALGSFLTLSGEIAGGPLRGTSSFTRLQGGGVWFRTVRPGWVLAAQVRAGAIDPFGRARPFTPEVQELDPEVGRVPLEDRFRIGGVNSVRGYNENEIPRDGGLALLQGNLELRVPLVGPFGAEVFVDAGNVWSRPAYVAWGDLAPTVSARPYSSGSVRYVAGVGARLSLPFGPMRFDVSWSARPEASGRDRRPRAQFAIGPSF